MKPTTHPHHADAGRRLLSGYSMEMTGKDIAGLEQARNMIPAGTRINVTFLANEELEMRVAAARAVKEMGFAPVPHISARCLRGEDELKVFLGKLQEIGATERVFVVGGDPTIPQGPYPDALTVIESGLLRGFGVREVAVAGYPEGHPLIPTPILDQYLEAKTTALAEQGLRASIITQFTFDTDPVVSWIRQVRAREISAPIRIGTPGPAGVKRLLSFARRFGIGANAMIVKKYGFSLANLMGTAGPDQFITSLAEQLAAAPNAVDVGIHLYAFGGLLATSQWASHYLADPAEGAA